MARVLSIQSHVVHGHVGNKSAVFPLQLLGIEVDAIDTVQFSNHTGYASFAGKVLDAEGLWALIEGLDKNDLLEYTHLLTGYMGSAALCSTVIRIAQKLKSINPNLVYVCDPVLGDNGKLYVPGELVGIYKRDVIPVADIITPNQFEVEQLNSLETGSLTTEQDVWRETATFHAAGVKTVVVTSFDNIGEGQIGILGSHVNSSGDSNSGSGSSSHGGGGGGGGGVYTFVLKVPKLDCAYTGTGDLFAALFLAWMRETPTEPHVAAEKVAATMQAVIGRTLAAANGSTSSKATELKLIQSKVEIEAPAVKYFAVCSGGAGAGAGAAAGARPSTAKPEWWG